MNRVLVVDDDYNLAHSICDTLRHRGIKSDCVISLSQAYARLTKRHYEVVILDRILGKEDGAELIAYLHDISYHTKILILSELAKTEERLVGLKWGVDEYLTKPCNTEELWLRLNFLLQIERKPKEKLLSLGKIVLNPETGKLKMGQRSTLLRRRENQILACLLRHKNAVVTRESLIEQVWGCENVPTIATVDVYIRRIRLIMQNHSLIKTIRGFGYLISDQSHQPTFLNY